MGHSEWIIGPYIREGYRTMAQKRIIGREDIIGHWSKFIGPYCYRQQDGYRTLVCLANIIGRTTADYRSWAITVYFV